jgi:signal transduction histidine kinase
MASDTGEGDRPPAEWLLGTTRSVQRTLREATTPTELGGALPDSLLAVPEHRFAWVGETYDGGVRPRTVPSDVDVPSWISTGAGTESDSETVRAETTGEIQVDAGDIDQPDRHALQEYVELPETASRVSVPLVTDETCYGILHLYTDADASVAPAPELLAELGETIAKQFQSLSESTQLDRERRRLEAFRSLVSHDLGNPLNIASGRLELAQDDCDSKHLDHTIDAIERIDTLIDQGLRFVQAGKPPEDFESLSLAELGEECWAEVREEPIARDRSAALEIEDVSITASSKRLRMLLHELLRNAFVHSDGDLTVTTGPMADGSGFYVADTGPGIPANEREYVFDMGYTTASDRAGNGLTVVTEIAGAHGWTVQLGETERGTRVEIVTDRW